MQKNQNHKNSSPPHAEKYSLIDYLTWTFWACDLALLGDMCLPAGKLLYIIPDFRQKSRKIHHKWTYGASHPKGRLKNCTKLER
jgi:hypothetical protein